MSDKLTPQPVGESRGEQRYRVYWRAHLHLSQVRTIEARVKDISGAGLGLVTAEAITVGALLPITIRLPDADDDSKLLAAQCSVRVVNVVLSGRDYRMGALWVDRSASVRQTIESWILKLRYTNSVIG